METDVIHQIVSALVREIHTQEHRESDAGNHGEWSKAARHSTERQALTKFYGEVRRITASAEINISEPSLAPAERSA